MLVFNPEKRPSAETCLKHSYVARFHSKKDNLDVGYNVIPPINDDIQLTVDEYRQRLYAMIQVKFSDLRTETSSQTECPFIKNISIGKKKSSKGREITKRFGKSVWRPQGILHCYISII